MKSKKSLDKPLPKNVELDGTIASVFPSRIAIVDCETTGLSYKNDRITEVGLVIVDDGVVVDQWSTLVNPDRAIPSKITKLTGISNVIVSSAPTFADIEEKLFELLEGRTLIAHNAKFDYGFLKSEFERAGKSYRTRPMCTLRLSRALFPNYKGHSLQAIIDRFDIEVEDRHRALDDAIALWGFLVKCSSSVMVHELESSCKAILAKPSVPSNLAASELDKLPNLPGVYRFYDKNDALLYVGKSVNIKSRVLSHFSGDYENPKDLKINALLKRIEFDRTPSDFGAQLLESSEIKHLFPIYNRQLRRVKKLYHLVVSKNRDGYKTVETKALELVGSSSEVSDGIYRSPSKARKALGRFADEFQLCHQLCGLETFSAHGCFRRQLKRCKGACCGLESASSYNLRLSLAMESQLVPKWPFAGGVIVKEQCKADPSFETHHLVDDWIYQGVVEHKDVNEGGDRTTRRNSQIANSTGQDLGRGSKEASKVIPQMNPATLDIDTYFILRRFIKSWEEGSDGHLTITDLPTAL